MKFNDFVEALQAAGWKGTLDAQHHNIKVLWVRLYPVIAELEDELSDFRTDIEK